MKLIDSTAIIAEITIAREDGIGWIATLDNGETAWLTANAKGLCDCNVGDIVLAALDRHNRYPSPHWHANWAVPISDTDLVGVDAAMVILNDGPATSGEVGPSAGDILYHSGEAAKFVKRDRNQDFNPDNDIYYTLHSDMAYVAEDMD